MDYSLIVSAVLALVNSLFLYSIVRKDKEKDKAKEDFKDLVNRVNNIDNRHVTSEQVKELLREKVEPIENSLRMLERDMRESYKDLAREFRESNQIQTESIHEMKEMMLGSLNEVSSTVQFIKGKLEARRDND